MPVSNNTRSNKGETPTKDLSLVALSLTSPQPSSGRRKTAIKSKLTNRGSVKKGPKSDVAASRKARQHANQDARKAARKKLKDKSRSTPIKAEVLVSKPVLQDNEQKASDITTDILSNIKHVATVSHNAVDNQKFTSFNYHKTLSKHLELFLARRATDQNMKLWLFLKGEGCLAGGNLGFIILPIIMAFESVYPPMNYLAEYNSDNDVTSYSTFTKAGFKWEALKGLKNVNILVSSSTNFKSDYNLLPLTKPSKIEALESAMLQPDRVHQQLSLKYNGINVMARPTCIKSDCEDAIKDEQDLSEDDLELLIEAAKREDERQQDKYSGQVLSEKSHFTEMVTGLARETKEEESAIKASLEAIKVFKIYPAYEDGTLPPPTVAHTFVGIQTKGEVKNLKYDERSLYGTVDGLY